MKNVENQKYLVTISGLKLLMHNGQLSDPLNAYAKSMKEISKKVSKTDADHAELKRREFIGSLYFDSDDPKAKPAHKGMGPFIPRDWLEAMLIEGARKKRKGKDFESSIFVVDEQYPLEYDGPRDMESLSTDPKFRLEKRIVVGKGKSVIRTRPLFRNWRVTFEVEFPAEFINASDVEEAITAAGHLVGLGDWRPRYGRFTNDVFELVRMPKPKAA